MAHVADVPHVHGSHAGAAGQAGGGVVHVPLASSQVCPMVQVAVPHWQPPHGAFAGGSSHCGGVGGGVVQVLIASSQV